MSAGPRDGTSNRLRERRIMLIVWTISVAVVIWLGAGFGGGFEEAYSENLPAWLIAASPLIPLILWLKARRDFRSNPEPRA